MGPVKASFYTAEAAYQASKWWDDSVIRHGQLSIHPVKN
jgi:hypothetical protein